MSGVIMMIRKNIQLAMIFLLTMPLSLVNADPALQARIDQVKKNPDAVSAAQGKEAAAFCVLCHGEDGNSSKPDVPHLAEQNPVYLLDQIERFASGQRNDYIMTPLARKLTSDEKVALVIYYSNQKRRIEDSLGKDPAVLITGREIFEKNCVSCHGDDGRGKEGYAYIAGLQEKYIVSTLTRFREPNKHRESTLMSAVAKNLGNNDIDALAAYISSLR
jgi:cbb3-type cytochrome c oxidase subunit III